MRSICRFLIEDPVGYFNELERINADKKIVKDYREISVLSTYAVIGFFAESCSTFAVSNSEI